MAQKFDYSYRPFKLAANTGAYVRVKLDGANVNQVAIAGAGEVAIGVTDRGGIAGDTVPVKMIQGGEGTFKVTASGAIAANAALYGTANGCVDDAGGGTPQFTSLQAASGAGSIIEAMKCTSSAASLVGQGAAVANVAAQTQDTLTDSTTGVVSITTPPTLVAVRVDTTAHTATDAQANFATLNAELIKTKADVAALVTTVNALLAQLRIGGSIGT